MLEPRIRGRWTAGPVVRAAAAYGMATCFVLLVVLTVAPAVPHTAETRITAGPAPPRSAVVALLTRTSTGRIVQRGSGFCIEPGVFPR